MSTDEDASRYYWTRHTDGRGQWRRDGGAPGLPPGADLAQMRRGLGREPGSVPGMWRFHTTMNEDGRSTRSFRAEHHTLSLFALHQQSQGRPMHRSNVGLGTAVRCLLDPAIAKESGASAKRDRVDPVDRAFAAAATAGSQHELVLHLRGLITRLRGAGQGLDYNQLFTDLTFWDYPEAAARVRRRWGMQYFVDRTNTPSISTNTEEQQ